MASPATTPPASTTPVPPGSTSSDWTVQVADTIESVVGSVRDKTAIPLETVARALVYGIVLGTMVVTALILVTILLIRVMTIEVADRSLPVWGAYLILGAIFTLGGMFLWRKRRPPSGRDGK
ncbi:MAG TPA: hypothetical protein VM143_09610 [Acidimicrobiales bacterium]|nr:hypothetical protein [Acidimicrobiales bacterium]